MFPDFTAETPAAMRQEVLLFLGWVFNEGRGVKDIFTAPVGFVNSALAPIYGLPATGFTTARSPRSTSIPASARAS